MIVPAEQSNNNSGFLVNNILSTLASIIFLFVASCVSSHVHAWAGGNTPPNEAAPEEIAEQILLINNMEAMWEPAVAEFKKSMAGQVDPEKFEKVCAKYLKYSDVKPTMVNIYVTHMSKEELAAFHRFINLPSTQRALKETMAAWRDGRDPGAAFKTALFSGTDKEVAQVDEFFQSPVWQEMSRDTKLQEAFFQIIPDIIDVHREEFRAALLH